MSRLFETVNRLPKYKLGRHVANHSHANSDLVGYDGHRFFSAQSVFQFDFTSPEAAAV